MYTLFPLFVSLVFFSLPSTFRHSSLHLLLKKKRHTLHRFCIFFSLSHPFFDLLYSQTPPHVLCPDSNKPFLHPHCSNKIVLVKTTNDLYAAKANGQFSIFIPIGFPVDFFPLLETLPPLDSAIPALRAVLCPLSTLIISS